MRALVHAFASGVLWGACFTEKPGRCTRALERIAARVYKLTQVQP